MKSQHTCFVIPLDHKLEWTADYQRQIILQIQKKPNSSLILYHAYAPRQSWKNVLSRHFWQQHRKKVAQAQQAQVLDFFPLHVIPFERFSWIYTLNQKLSFLISLLLAWFILKPHHFIFWIFHPRYYHIMKLSKDLIGSSVKVVYDCVDFLTFTNTVEENVVRSAEKKLLKDADMVSVISSALLNKHRPLATTIKLFPTGFRDNDFKDSPFTSLTQKNRVTLLFVGAINDRIDFDLITQLAKKNKNWHIHLIGPIGTSEGNILLSSFSQALQSERYSNISHTPYIKPQELPQYYHQASVGIIPYDLSIPFNYYCNPMKLFEYFYFGVPVVSTPIPSLKDINSPFIATGETAAEWEDAISHFLKHPPSSNNQAKMRAIALENTWDKKFTQIINCL